MRGYRLNANRDVQAGKGYSLTIFTVFKLLLNDIFLCRKKKSGMVLLSLAATHSRVRVVSVTSLELRALDVHRNQYFELRPEPELVTCCLYSNAAPVPTVHFTPVPAGTRTIENPGYGRN